MNFSYEEIYYMYGQYDTPVLLCFHEDSEAYKIFGKQIHGVFLYTENQRNNLQELLSKDSISRTDKRICFSPTYPDKLSEKQKVFLDREGIQSGNVEEVKSLKLSRVNLYNQKGIKKIPGQLEIKVNFSYLESQLMMLGLYKDQLNTGKSLAILEMDDYFALKMLHEPNTFSDEDNSYINDENGKVKKKIHEKYLYYKGEIDQISPEEKEELNNIWKENSTIALKTLEKEIIDSGNLLNKLPIDLRFKLGYITLSFREHVIAQYPKSIWLDLERFLHIYIRHTSDLQPDGEYKEKTVFQYDFKDTYELIKAVIQSIEKEIEEEFKKFPNRTFKRLGKRAVYYNGNYYRIEIEPSGRLLTFHPINNPNI